MCPLDWNKVKEKYQEGALVPHIAGPKQFQITKVTEDAIYFKWAAVSNGVIHRKNLERLVDLLEQGAIGADPTSLTSDYRTLVADERPSTAVSIAKDLGYL